MGRALRLGGDKLWARCLVRRAPCPVFCPWEALGRAGFGSEGWSGPCLCAGELCGLRVSPSGAPGLHCPGVCGAQRFPRSGRTLRSYGRYPTCRGTSLPGEGLCCEPVRASRGLCHPGLSESLRGLAVRNSQQTTRWAWGTASPRFPRLSCLIPVVNSDRGTPAMSALETGDVAFSVPHLVLLFSSASAFRNELLSLVPVSI